MSAEKLLQRPIYGGAFGDDGRYSLASVPCISHGLHATRYMVVQAQAGLVLSVSEDKTAALALARQRLSAANDKRQPPKVSTEQGELWPDEPLLSPVPAPAPYVSRRRREILTAPRASATTAAHPSSCSESGTLNTSYHARLAAVMMC